MIFEYDILFIELLWSWKQDMDFGFELQFFFYAYFLLFLLYLSFKLCGIFKLLLCGFTSSFGIFRGLFKYIGLGRLSLSGLGNISSKPL